MRSIKWRSSKEMERPVAALQHARVICDHNEGKSVKLDYKIATALLEIAYQAMHTESNHEDPSERSTWELPGFKR